MWIPVKDSLALTLKVKRAKPETEPKMKIIKFFLERTVVMERDPLRSYLDQYEAMENDAIDEGLGSLKEEPTITFEELDRRISEKFGWK